MIWFHTVVLPLGTLFLVLLGVRKGAPVWKLALLVLGCALILGGLWTQAAWSTLALVAGGVTFLVGVPRPAAKPG